MVTAIAPIEPICKSRTATSGVRVAMAFGTSRPLRQTVNDVSGEPSAARTSSRTHWASVASKICTSGILAFDADTVSCSEVQVVQ